MHSGRRRLIMTVSRQTAVCFRIPQGGARDGVHSPCSVQPATHTAPPPTTGGPFAGTVALPPRGDCPPASMLTARVPPLHGRYTVDPPTALPPYAAQIGCSVS